MRWQNRASSDNVEDRRGRGGMPLRGMPVGGKTGAILLIAVLVAGYFGFDLTPILNMVGGGGTQLSMPARQSSSANDELARFTSVTLKTQF